MIGGATRGRGGRGLAVHLADARLSGHLNEKTVPGASRGLVTDGIEAQIAELTAICAHARHATPLYHCHADPPADRDWNDNQWERYWTLFEAEFHLEEQPFAEACHLKIGDPKDGEEPIARWHRHRAYSLVKPNGACVRMDNDHARREKIHRMIELEDGQTIIKGAHNLAVVNALEKEGQHDLAAMLVAAGITEGERQRAKLTPEERAQQERTGVRKTDVQASVWAAWQASDSGPAFVAALESEGYRIAMGDKVPVVVDATGNTHPLARLIAAEAKKAGQKIKADVVQDRLAGLAFGPVAEVRAVPIPQPAPMPSPASADAEIAERESYQPTAQTSPKASAEAATPAITVVVNQETPNHGPDAPAPATPPNPTPATQTASVGIEDRRRDQGGHRHDSDPADRGDRLGEIPARRSDRVTGIARARTAPAISRSGKHRCAALRLRARLWAQPEGWVVRLSADTQTRPTAGPVEPYIRNLKAEMVRQDRIISAPAPAWQSYRDDPKRRDAFRLERQLEKQLHDLLDPETPPGFFRKLINHWRKNRVQKELAVASAERERVDQQMTAAYKHDAGRNAAAVAKAESIYRRLERVVSAIEAKLPRTELGIKCGQPFDDILQAASRDWDDEDGRRERERKAEAERAEKLEFDARVKRAAENKRKPAKSATDDSGWEPKGPK